MSKNMFGSHWISTSKHVVLNDAKDLLYISHADNLPVSFGSSSCASDAQEKSCEIVAMAAAEGMDAREANRTTGLCPVLSALESAPIKHAAS